MWTGCHQPNTPIDKTSKNQICKHYRWIRFKWDIQKTIFLYAKKKNRFTVEISNSKIKIYQTTEGLITHEISYFVKESTETEKVSFN